MVLTENINAIKGIMTMIRTKYITLKTSFGFAHPSTSLRMMEERNCGSTHKMSWQAEGSHGI